MTAASCFIGPDLALLRLFIDGAEHTWRRTEPSAEELDNALWWKQQANAAAQWTREHLAGATLDAICLDVDGASCVWLSAPSADPAVVAAAMRQPDSSWDELGIAGTIQPLSVPESKRTGPSIPFLSRPTEDDAPSRMAVLATPDAMVRLWLDALDRMGIEAGTVHTLWHAAQGAWGGADATTESLGAVVIHDGKRLVWTWGRGPNLAAAGSVSLARLPADPDAPENAPPKDWDYASSCGRLTLDWLTWAAQLGSAPATILAIGPDASALARALERSWPEAQVRSTIEADPLAHAVQSLTDESPGAPVRRESDPRRSVVALSRRRGRAHRWLYTWCGAAMALLAVAIGAYGLRKGDLADDLKRDTQTLAGETRVVVSEVAPTIADRGDRVMALESEMIKIRKDRPNFSEPAKAKPILDELARLFGVMAELADDAVHPEEIVIADRFPTARVRVPDFAVGDELRARLDAVPGAIRWTVTFETALGADGQRWRLAGEWVEGAP